MTRSFRRARGIALLLPLVLLAGAWGFQLIGHLYPCEMCHWQRWPHYAAIVVAALAFASPPRSARVLVGLAALLIAVSGTIAVAHAGVEYRWWPGFTACTGSLDLAGLSPAERLQRIMGAPVVPCDVTQWKMLGISLAGFNAILSLGGAGVIAHLLGKRR